jgi:CRP-like cAMP-binding protein
MRRKDPKVDKLHHVPLFAGLGDGDLRTIAASADLVHVVAGQLLHAATTSHDAAVFILEGTAVVDGTALLGPGGFHGAVAMLDGDADDGDLRMLTDGAVLVFGRRQFAGVLVAVPAFATALAKALSERLRSQHLRNHVGARDDR